MSEGRYTPGPYEVHQGADYIVVLRGPNEITDEGIRFDNLPDAQLYSAAPELLEALQGLMPTNVCLDNKQWPDGQILPLDVTLGELRAAQRAIAKALGNPLKEEGPSRMWRCSVSERPTPNSRVVVLYEDGSGAVLGFWTGDQLIDSDGDEYIWENPWISHWAYLPSGFRLWCENRAEDPVAFPGDSDRSGEAGETTGSTEGESAGPEDIAQP